MGCPGEEISIFPHCDALFDYPLCLCLVDLPSILRGNEGLMCHSQVMLHSQHTNHILSKFYSIESDTSRRISVLVVKWMNSLIWIRIR